MSGQRWSWNGTELTAQLLMPPATWRLTDTVPLVHASATLQDSGYGHRHVFRFSVAVGLLGVMAQVSLKLPLESECDD